MSSASFLRFGQQAGHGRDPGDQPDALSAASIRSADSSISRARRDRSRVPDVECRRRPVSCRGSLRQRERGVCRRNANVAGERDSRPPPRQWPYGRDERFPGVLESADPVMVRARLAEIAEDPTSPNPLMSALRNARSPAPFSKITRTSDPVRGADRARQLFADILLIALRACGRLR